ncbi:hypothetical protein SAMN05444397_104324 [Flavobacterium aquidurense]|uniref:SdpI/YhfL protein family protein n=1 Tax=Flavobacterium frigidimaris TaxID=262320 RepID=A0ABX4BMC5_FLAFR|nr:hypothetical protein [Flavobacterium frigidimaris]OXA77053.1 hypothetical protein B0A65_17250 [Flavobacterium frigidimaris]SDZ24668.1 hypothetical protein SAMN05444397_104324 [Flavobacterium aquidurense]
MIVWSGRGFLSLLILFIAIFLFIPILPETYITQSFVIPLYIAAVFSFIFGLKWNKTLRIFIDKETGKEINFKNNHGLFWINMEYWGIIFPLFALVILMQSLDKQGAELYLNIFLILIGIGCLLYFGITLFKIKNSTISNSEFQKTDVAPQLSFVKEEMIINKFNNEDPNQYLPK